MKRTQQAMPETWRVVAKGGRFVLIHERSGLPLDPLPEDELIRQMVGMGLWESLVQRLELSTDRLLNHAKASSPAEGRINARVAEGNYGVIAQARAASPTILRLTRDRQIALDLGEAA